jgi:hypothetical protein
LQFTEEISLTLLEIKTNINLAEESTNFVGEYPQTPLGESINQLGWG